MLIEQSFGCRDFVIRMFPTVCVVLPARTQAVTSMARDLEITIPT